MEEIIKKLRDLADSRDIEEAHIEADEILCDLVADYVPRGTEIVKLFNKIEKWYA
jgi:hypothetical protein